jgi:hypothetical protein
VAGWLIANADWTLDQRRTMSQALSSSVEGATRARKPGRVALRWFVRAMSAALPFVIAMYLLSWFGSPEEFPDFRAHLQWWRNMIAWSLAGTVYLAWASVPLSIWFDTRRLRRARAAMEALSHVGEPASLSAIARAYVQRPLREAASRALVKVAARLRPEDHGTVSGDTVPALCRAISKADPETEIVILQALAAVGDGRAIPAVERVAITAQSPQTREAAYTALPILRQRAEDSRASGMLLRPSSARGGGEPVLLRAASAGTNADAAQMLMRAAAGRGRTGTGVIMCGARRSATAVCHLGLGRQHVERRRFLYSDTPYNPIRSRANVACSGSTSMPTQLRSNATHACPTDPDPKPPVPALDLPIPLWGQGRRGVRHCTTITASTSNPE